jgi:tetratricopeptide (TPR) repeat protein
MTFSWIPDALKQQIIDAVVNFIGKQAEDLVGAQLGDKVRGLSSQGTLRKALSGAIERGIARFQREYIEIDEDLTEAILATPAFWSDREVQQAILTLVSNPVAPDTQLREKVVEHFELILPQRRNRDRVDRAVTRLLGTIAEEIWAAPGADQVRQLYELQLQRLGAEALQQQVALLRANFQATAQLGNDFRQALQQLLSATEQRLLAAPVSVTAKRRRPFHNLPQRNYNRFIGRQRELERLQKQLLPNSRSWVVTLDGIGGVGKSTLALECAYYYRDRYADLPSEERFEAIVWVSAKRTLLTANGIQQREQTFSTLADLYRAIGTVLDETTVLRADRLVRRSLVEHALVEQRTLLIVDNLETVDDEELLSFLRELPAPTKAIVTTRHRIDITYTIRLNGLPKTDALVLMANEAARKSVVLSVDHIDDFLRRTGGIPLAIVWSIGLMSFGHSVEAVLRRLGSGHSDIAHFCFAESFTLIRSRDAERLLLALAMFEASVSRTMLGEVAGLGDDEIGRDDGLAELEQLSLVDKESDRFSLLPLTRAFALEALELQPDMEKRLQHQWIETLKFFAKPYANPDWRWRDLRRLRGEGHHLVTLAQWAQQLKRIDIFLDVLPGLLSYYDGQGDWANLLDIGEIGLGYAQVAGDIETRVYVLNLLSWILSQQGKHADAEQAIESALNLAREQGVVEWEADLLQTLSQALRRKGDLAKSVQACMAAMALIDSLPADQRDYLRANIEYELGKVARDKENWREAKRLFERARAIYREDIANPVFNIERTWGLLSNLGLVAHKLGNLDEAIENYRKALAFFRTEGGIVNVATLLVRMAALEEQRGQINAAGKYAREALELCQQMGLAQERAEAESLLRQIEA